MICRVAEIFKSLQIAILRNTQLNRALEQDDDNQLLMKELPSERFIRTNFGRADPRWFGVWSMLSG